LTQDKFDYLKFIPTQIKFLVPGLLGAIDAPRIHSTLHDMPHARTGTHSTHGLHVKRKFPVKGSSA